MSQAPISTSYQNGEPAPPPAAEPSATLSAALNAARRGWPVVPLRFRTKIPHLKAWRERASTDPEEIRAWWSAWPDADLAILTGARSGVVVLDIDGEEGEESTIGLDLPETPVSITGGGMHFYFRHPGGDVPGSLNFLPGIDLLSDGRLAKAPPSQHGSGRRYEWLVEPGESELAPPPESILKLVRDARKPPERDDSPERSRAPAPPATTWPRTARPAAAALAGLLVPVWREGRRHRLALAVGGCLAAHRWQLQDVMGAVRTVATLAGDQEFEDREQAVRDAFERRIAGEPSPGFKELRTVLGDEGVAILRRIAAPMPGSDDQEPPDADVPELNRQTAAVLHYILLQGGGSAVAVPLDEAAADLDISRRALRQRLSRARSLGLVETVHKARRGHPQVLRITDRGKEAFDAYSLRLPAPVVDLDRGRSPTEEASEFIRATAAGGSP